MTMKYSDARMGKSNQSMGKVHQLCVRYDQVDQVYPGRLANSTRIGC